MTAPWDEEFDLADPHAISPEKQALSMERSEELRNAIQKLPQRQQQILEMTYWMNMKSNEIGEALGMAPSSVRVALKQARERLKTILEKT